MEKFRGCGIRRLPFWISGPRLEINSEKSQPSRYSGGLYELRGELRVTRWGWLSERRAIM